MSRQKSGFWVVILLLAVAVVLSLMIAVLVTAQQTVAASGTVELTGWLIDKCCSEKTKDPSKHTRSCNLMESCAATGYGVMVKQADDSYKFYKFDPKGDVLAANYLKKTKKEDNLTVTVKGTWEGKLLKVASLMEKNLPIELMGWLMDKCCVEKAKDPAKHTRTCNMMESCAASGYGIIVKQGDSSYKFYKFDEKGHNLAADYLKKTPKENNLTIMVKGTWDGESLHVTSFMECNETEPATEESTGCSMDMKM